MRGWPASLECARKISRKRSAGVARRWPTRSVCSICIRKFRLGSRKIYCRSGTPKCCSASNCTRNNCSQPRPFCAAPRRCATPNGSSRVSLGSDSRDENDPNLARVPPRWSICKIACNNIWARTSPSITAKNGGRSKSNTTGMTIFNALSRPSAAPRRRDGALEEWGAVTVKSLLHSSTTSFLLLLLLGCRRAENSPATETKIWAEFSGDRAFAHVQQLVDLGPRPPQSDALEKTRVYIDHQLRLAGWTVEAPEFADETPRGLVRFVNLIARFHAPGKVPTSFLLCSHYDTKIFETFRFVGANDAGSSTGLLLEAARALGRYPDLAAKVQLVFFDGEEAFETFSETDGLYGSRHFAKQLERQGAKQFRGGILFDIDRKSVV